MNTIKTPGMLAALVLGGGLALSAQAAPINVGGVVWDPSYTDGSVPAVEEDFIGRFSFTQWYSAVMDPTGTLNSFSSAETIGTVLASQGGGAGATGLFLAGAGEFYQINDPAGDVLTSSATGGGPASFCPGCELTFAFGGIGLNGDGSFDLSQSWAHVYVDHTPNFAIPVNSQGRADGALDGALWLELSILDLGFTSLANGLASGYVDVTFGIVGGLAAGYFDPQIAFYNASAFFGTTATTADLSARYSSGGNGSVQANTVPEPGLLGLLGLGLLGLGLARRHK